MEILEHLFRGAIDGIGTSVGGNVLAWVTRLVKSFAGGLKSPGIKMVISQLGNMNPATTRQLVQQRLGNNRNITDAERTELVDVLVQLTKGARTLTTQGTPRSSYVRCERLIEQLLKGLEIKRKKGELVAPGQDWVLERFLGLGAFGEVWLATNRIHPHLKRAYKFFTSEKAIDWLLKENNSLMAVKEQLGEYPGVARLEDVCTQGPFPHLVFEFVAGGSLEDWLLEDTESRVKLDIYETMQAIVGALAEAHRKKIYHLDLKPANILVTSTVKPLPKVTDFGLASADMINAAGSSAGTALGLVQAGTPMYWPPEALEVRAECRPGQQDVFALGVVWYQLAVNRVERPPYDFEETLRCCGHDTHTIRLISGCLACPERRFPDASELEEAMSSADLPRWQPAPEGFFDVSQVVREYIATVKI